MSYHENTAGKRQAIHTQQTYQSPETVCSVIISKLFFYHFQQSPFVKTYWSILGLFERWFYFYFVVVVVIVDLLISTLHDTQNSWKKVKRRLWQGRRGKGFQKVQRTSCDKIWTKETKAHPRALCRQRRSTSAWQGSQGAPYVTTAPGKTAPSCLIYKTNRHSFSPSTSRRQENRTAPFQLSEKKKRVTCSARERSEAWAGWLILNAAHRVK